MSSIFGSVAQAAGEEYTFAFPDETSFIRAVNAKLGEGDPPSQASQTAVYARGGFWDRLGGGKPVTLGYNKKLSEKANDKPVFDVKQTNGEDDDQYIFTTDYLCYNNGSAFEQNQAKIGSLNQSLYYVQVAVVVELGSSGDFSTRENYKGSVFSDIYQKIFPILGSRRTGEQKSQC